MMKNTVFNLNKILKSGNIDNELDFERAAIMDRKLRLLARDHPELEEKRKRLRDILIDYEEKVWVNAEITDEKVLESDLAEAIAEEERMFLFKRTGLIRQRLKSLSLSQKDLGKILGHTSITYISELVNGISPFTTRDLIVIHLLLKIDFEDLIPTMLGIDERAQLAEIVSQVSNAKLKVNEQSLELVAV